MKIERNPHKSDVLRVSLWDLVLLACGRDLSVAGLRVTRRD